MRKAAVVCALLLALLPAAHAAVAAGGAPPAEFRGVYLSAWSAATPARVARVVQMARQGLMNTVIIDVKDATGYVAFDTAVPAAEAYGAKRVLIRDLEGLVRRLKAEGLWVAARIVVFTDPRLAEARPDLAVHSAARLAVSGGAPTRETLWRDRRGLAWIDPAAREAWVYNAAIAEDALRRGFDEINFDYIRFPSDGALADMVFPVWRQSRPRREVLREFFAWLRTRLGEAVISADLFGLSTVNRDDLGIGQVIEDALPYFDYVCPMVYPSHYAPGFIGKQNPAEYPYEVVFYSMKTAADRAAELGEAARAKLRPWLQDFDLGADYTPEMVFEQIQAARDALGEDYVGFVVWNPKNVYQVEALEMARR